MAFGKNEVLLRTKEGTACFSQTLKLQNLSIFFSPPHPEGHQNVISERGSLDAHWCPRTGCWEAASRTPTLSRLHCGPLSECHGPTAPVWGQQQGWKGVECPLPAGRLWTWLWLVGWIPGRVRNRPTHFRQGRSAPMRVEFVLLSM